MRILVRTLSEGHVEITTVPSWLDRLFGDKMRRSKAHRDVDQLKRWSWFWDTIDHWVGTEIEREISLPIVESLPTARSLR